MKAPFNVGDYVCVRRVPASPWQDMCGTVVDVIFRGNVEALQECSVSFGGVSRWFMAEHLTKSVPPKFIRFFQHEVIERWKLDPIETPRFSGHRDQLVEFLLDHYEFTIRRAEAEVDEFYFAFDNRIKQASALSAGPSRSAA
jgi:hypothetical protein